MHRHMMKSKIHRAKVTQADLHYEGSLTVDQTLMDAAQMIPYEMIKVYNVDNGERFETYVIPGPAGSGVMCLNGAAARKGQVGDLLIIVTSAWMTEQEAARHEPVVVLVDKDNRIKKESNGETAFLKVAQ
jgi:aspartate 1-decarboxylase